MTKKEYIIKLLESLEDSWEVAKGLKIVINGLEDDNKLLDNLFGIFKESITELKDEKLLNKINSSLSSLKELKHRETLEKGEDNLELDVLEKELELLV